MANNSEKELITPIYLQLQYTFRDFKISSAIENVPRNIFYDEELGFLPLRERKSDNENETRNIQCQETNDVQNGRIAFCKHWNNST